MTGLNQITLSYDRQTAVRAHDKLKLRAVTRPPNGRRCCDGCLAHALEVRSCYSDQSRDRACEAVNRKDGRNIRWEAANE